MPIDRSRGGGVIARLGQQTRTLFRLEVTLAVLLAMFALGLFMFLRIATEVSEGETMTMDRAILLRAARAGKTRRANWSTVARQSDDGDHRSGRRHDLNVAHNTRGSVSRGSEAPGDRSIRGWRGIWGRNSSAVLKNFFERPRPELVGHLVSATSATSLAGMR